MRITALAIYSQDVPRLIQHCRDLIGLTLLNQAETSATFQIGWSRFTLQHTVSPLPTVYHIAFGITPNSIIGAKTWLENRTALLRDGSGGTQFTFSEGEANAIYWKDPDDNILELVAPVDEARPAHDTSFTSDDIVGVSEIGIPTDDVITYANQLTEQHGIHPYRTVNDSFTPMGSDVYGRLIVVKSARLWFPELIAPALPLPLSVEIDGKSISIESTP